MTMPRPETVASPLTVKEQFEASANRFWSSMRNLKAEEATNEEALTRQEKPLSVSGESNTIENAQPVSFQSVIHAVFGSCTTGVPYEGKSSRHSRSTRTTISPTCSGEGATEVHNSTRSCRLDNSSGVENRSERRRMMQTPSTPPRPAPVAPRTKLFQDSRDRAEEAVLHLREQQLQLNQDLQQQNLQCQRQKDYEGVVSSRGASTKATSQYDCSNKTATPPPTRPFATKKELSFFPVSKPCTARDPAGSHGAYRNISVPKEVSSPPRRGLAGKAVGVPGVAATFPRTEAKDDDLFDFDDDGISCITQETVDRMVKDMEEQQKDFPNDFLLNRVYSDVTDPADRSFGQGGNLFRPEGETASAGNDPRSSLNESRSSLQEGRYMTPPRLTRQNRSSETRSFFTRTTHSTDPDDFDAWKEEEQQYWDSLVAKEESTTIETDFVHNVRTKNVSGTLNQFGGSGRGSGRMIPPSPRSLKLQRAREMMKRNVVRLNASSVTSRRNNIPTGNSVDNEYLSDHDREMNVMMLQSDVDMAEI